MPNTKRICPGITTLQAAKKFFDDCLDNGRDDIPNIEVLTWAYDTINSEILDSGSFRLRARQSISDTLNGSNGKSKLSDQPWYYDYWHRVNKGGRVYHVRGRVTAETLPESFYDCPSKRYAAGRIMRYLPTQGSPRLLTLAGTHGCCIRAARERNSSVTVDNVERKTPVFDEWVKTELGHTTINFKMDLEKFVDTTNFIDQSYDVVNMDCMGFYANWSEKVLLRLNETCNSKVVALTVTEHLRGRKNFLRERVGRNASFDKVIDYIMSLMTNYEMVEQFSYQSESKRTPMHVLIFKRKR